MHEERRTVRGGDFRICASRPPGDGTIKDRLALLQRQREGLLERQDQIAQALERLEYKIARYEDALNTGILNWTKEEH